MSEEKRRLILARRRVGGIARVLLAVFALSGCSSASLIQSPPGDAAVDDDGGTATSDAGEAYDGNPPTSPSVSVIVEPSDDGQALVAAIQGAKRSVHMTMYILSSSTVINALVAQKQAGREVKVVLNQTFPTGGGSNASAYRTLHDAGVEVVWAPSAFTYTHEKCVVIDGAQAWIMTMNAAATTLAKNREFLAVASDADDVTEAEAIFAGDFAGQRPLVSGRLVVAPVNAKERTRALVDGASRTVDVETEELSDPVIVGALAARADAGVKVRVVLPGIGTTRTPAQDQAVTTLKAHHVAVVTNSDLYIHGKTIVADGARAYVGSENFTTNSLDYNRELGVVFAAADEVAKVDATIAADFAAGSAL